MKILLTGANGYIGMRLLPVLVEAGHDVVCCVRSQSRFPVKKSLKEKVEVFEIDFLKPEEAENPPTDFDAAFYLMHSMSGGGNFEEKEQKMAENFVGFLDKTSCRQLVYLSGIVNTDELSQHLRSRLKTEEILKKAKAKHTVLRAGIIVGSGSASFEIIRDLVEKLPVMITPKWLNTQCQPIAIRNVLHYLRDVLGHEKCLDKIFDIGGPDVLTYKEMLLQFAEVRGFKRYIFTLPVMTPRLSSYWLFFVTSTSYRLAVNLVNSMKVDVVAEKTEILDILPMELFSYKKAVELAFQKIEQNAVVSSWKDAMSGSKLGSLSEFVEVPQNGVFIDKKSRKIKNDKEQVIENIFSIGGQRGWYYGSFLWKIRGFLDQMVGGPGLRRGRTHGSHIFVGDSLDFWRVIVADREEPRLLLYAEMRLPGEAWLEFCIDESGETPILKQKAVFRPRGILGRLYWWSVLPFHYFVFNGMITNIKKFRPERAGRSVAHG